MSPFSMAMLSSQVNRVRKFKEIKTRVAASIKNEISRSFEVYCWVEQVRQIHKGIVREHHYQIKRENQALVEVVVVAFGANPTCFPSKSKTA